MCGIAGRILSPLGPVGADLVELMQAQRHRGGDSTGFGLYGEPRTKGYVVRVVAADRAAAGSQVDRFLEVCRHHGSDFLEDPTFDTLAQQHVSIRLIIDDPTSFEAWLGDADHIPGFEIQSVGRSLEIIKDLGDSYEVADKHRVRDFVGSHGIANARMATESFVSPTASHPFWARPYPDIAIVHNGQLTNFFTLRDRLRRAGYDFKTDNDSEAIAIWLSDQMAHGRSVAEALELSKTALDGVFTYILSTPTTVGFAKDKWAIKPLVVVEEPGGAMAVATEEQALRWIYTEEIDVTNHDGPMASGVFDVATDLALEAS